MPSYDYLTASGVIVEDAADVKTAVEGEYQAVFGDDVVLDGSTPPGKLIVAETTARTTMIRNNAAVANQINPNEAGGVFLDAICALTGLRRAASTFSVARDVVLTGRPQTPIPSGQLASQGIGGQTWQSLSSVIIGTDGTATTDFRCTVSGPVAAASGTINTPLAGGILGWDQVNNPSDAELGALQQTDDSLFRQRRRTLALQGKALPIAIQSRLAAIDPSISFSFRENVTNADAVIDGITVKAHGIWVCVDGGTDDEIAQALYASKGAGANWTGAVIVNVTDPVSGQVSPVAFDRPVHETIIVAVIASNATYNGDVAGAVRDAILQYQAGEIPGEDRIGVGDPISPFELAGAVNELYPGIRVRSCLVSISPAAPGPVEIILPLNQLGVITAGTITVTVQ